MGSENQFMPVFSLVNQYSFVIGSLAGAGLLGLILWRVRRVPAVWRVALFGAYLLAILGLRLALNYREGFDGSLASAEATLNNGRPTFLMLYSNY